MQCRDKNLLLDCVGWNARAWAQPISAALEETRALDLNDVKVLELGAGRISTIGSLFLRNKNLVTVTYYDAATRNLVVDRVAKLSEGTVNECVPVIELASVLDLTGLYDVIVMKSVLGGVFRNGAGQQDIDVFLQKICTENLNENGILITADNGVSYLDRFISKFGARSKNWRLFNKAEFKSATYQSCFGVLCAFSFQTRLGRFGKVVEDLVYLGDKALYLVFKNKPCVIVSVYSKSDLSN